LLGLNVEAMPMVFIRANYLDNQIMHLTHSKELFRQFQCPEFVVYSTLDCAILVVSVSVHHV